MESIIIILVLSNIVRIDFNQKPPYYHSYENDINLNYLYLLNHTELNSVIWRPPLEKPDIDYILYNTNIYSYDLLSFENFVSLDNFYLRFKKTK